MADPLLLQSMVIFKQAQTGGEVHIHQDATWLYTEPSSVLGFWFALEDATIDNGCIWAQPGGHRSGLRARFRRWPEAASAWIGSITRKRHSTPGGLRPPRSGCRNFDRAAWLLPAPQRPQPLSSMRAAAYSLHVIDGTCRYAEDNWLQRSPGMPLRGFDLEPWKTIGGARCFRSDLPSCGLSPDGCSSATPRYPSQGFRHPRPSSARRS